MSALADSPALPVYKGIGGNFKLNSTLNRKASLADFNNRLVILTFGYTNCADICPITLGFLNNVLKSMGSDAEMVQVLFVSVDPDYDTTDHLKKYLDYFNPGFIGLNGTRSEIDRVSSLYNIRYSKTSDLQVSTEYRKLRISKDSQSPGDDDTSSLYSHSTSIYLIDFNGMVRAVFDTTTSRIKIQQAVQSLLLETNAQP